MEGKEPMADVCGLAIEDLRASILEERNQLLKKFGHATTPRENHAGSGLP